MPTVLNDCAAGGWVEELIQERRSPANDRN